MVVLDDFAGPLVLVVAGLAVVLVVLEAFAPVVLVELPALPDAAFFFAVVVVVETFALELVVLVVLLAAVRLRPSVSSSWSAWHPWAAGRSRSGGGSRRR